MGENIKKIIKYVAIILETIILLSGISFFIALSGMTEPVNSVLVVFLV